MLIYFLLFFIPAGFYFLPHQNQEKAKKITIIMFFTILFLMLSLRGIDCGIDLKNYIILFYQSGNTNWNSLFTSNRIEYAYVLLEKTCYLITDDFQFFITVCAFLSLAPIAYVMIKETRHPLLEIILFMTVSHFPIFFSGIRQAIAMGLGMLAWLLNNKNKIIPFFITVIIAALFHTSALVLLFLFPITRFKIRKKRVLITLIIVAVIFIANRTIFSYMLSISFRYSAIYGTTFKETNSYTMLILLVLFLLYAFFIPDENKMEKEDFGFRNIIILSVLIQCFAPLHTLVMRFNYYFLLLIPIAISRFSDFPAKSMEILAKISIPIMILFFTIYFYIDAYTGTDGLHIFPYIPFWRS